MHVAVSIVGFRNSTDIASCLDSLSRATHQDFEVVICENGGEDAYRRLLQRIPGELAQGQPVRVILAQENLGFAGGVNQCLRATPEADAWWLLNPDTQPAEDALSAMVRRLSEGDCEAVGCTIVLPDGTVQSHGGRWRSWMARAELIGMGADPHEFVDKAAVERAQSFISGASMLVGRRFLDVVGFMREEYFLYVEEVEWCVRGLAKGMRLGFAPKAHVLHAHGTTTGAGRSVRDRPRMPVYLGERNKLLLTHDCFSDRFVVAAAASLSLLIVRCAGRGAWRHLSYGVAGWWAGVRGERGVPKWMQA